MKKEELLLLLQDIAEEDSDFIRLKVQYTKYRKNSLEVIKKIIIYGLEHNLFEILKKQKIKQEHVFSSIVIDDINKCLKIVKNNRVWNGADYSLCFKDTIKYYHILFGPYGPVGEHAFEGAKIPEEFIQFISD